MLQQNRILYDEFSWTTWTVPRFDISIYYKCVCVSFEGCTCILRFVSNNTTGNHQARLSSRPNTPWCNSMMVDSLLSAVTCSVATTESTINLFVVTSNKMATNDSPIRDTWDVCKNIMYGKMKRLIFFNQSLAKAATPISLPTQSFG